MSDQQKEKIELGSVAERLHGAHPLLSQMRQAMLAARTETTGIVEVPWMLRVLNVSVSKNQTSRALRIIDALVNPDHHLWNNHGTWWCHYTQYQADFTKQRVRCSLSTSDLQPARQKRDVILA